MANALHIARPYAKAAFAYAAEHQAIAAWQAALTKLAAMIANKQMIQLIKNPRPSPEQLAEICIDIGGKQFDQAQKNFIRLLASKRRLLALPNIEEEFEKLVREHNDTVAINVFSAIELTRAEQTKLQQALKSKLKQNVNIHYQVNKQLLGGLMIQIGDSVIDNSIAGQLSRLKASLVE